MTRLETRRRKKYRLKLQQAGAWTLLILAEIFTAAAPTTLAAVIILPLVHIERGYYAVGGEWLFILLVFCGTFYMLHNKVCDKIFKEE